jgi:MFS family permease
VQWRREPWRSALILVLIQTSIGLWLMPRLNFFPVYLQDVLRLSPQTIGMVVSGGQVAGMVAALMGGALTGRLGSKGLLVWGLILSVISSLAYQTESLWLVSFFWFVGGAGVAMMTVGGSSYLTGLSVKGSLGMLAALYALSLTVGGSFSNPVVGWLVEGYGYRVFGLVELALIGLIALLTALVMRSQRGDGGEMPRGSFLS